MRSRPTIESAPTPMEEKAVITAIAVAAIATQHIVRHFPPRLQAPRKPRPRRACCRQSSLASWARINKGDARVSTAETRNVIELNTSQARNTPRVHTVQIAVQYQLMKRGYPFIHSVTQARASHSHVTALVVTLHTPFTHLSPTHLRGSYLRRSQTPSGIECNEKVTQDQISPPAIILSQKRNHILYNLGSRRVH